MILPTLRMCNLEMILDLELLRRHSRGVETQKQADSPNQTTHTI